MTDLERRAALALKPYFSKTPVIVDIGSNKGDWSNVLIRNVDEAFLFEPNIKLNHYSQIRFDDVKTFVVYNDVAVFSSCGEREFFYFDNSNNGLSSVFYNQVWVDMGLPMKRGKVRTITLDSFWAKMERPIDMVKIDVEGADVDVLIGAKKVLERRKVKFIQIEHSDHILLSGHSFADVFELVRPYGYDLFHFNGQTFEKYTDQKAENFYIMDKDFTQDWNREFIANTKGLGPFEFALEIGCFEGLTSCYICDNLLKPEGRMICIDPLTDEYLPGHEDNALFVGQYERFERNTRGYPIELLRMPSNDAFSMKGFRDYRFDFIYIDGDHRREQVYKDGFHAFEVCRLGGYILFDDYQWRQETKDGIDQFLKDHHGLYDMVHNGYQILIKKYANRV